MLVCGPRSAGAADTTPGSSSHPVEGLPGSPHPRPLQVLDHQQQYGFLVDPSLPRVPGHPGESGAVALPTAALSSASVRAPSLLRKGLPWTGDRAALPAPALPCPGLPLMAHSAPLQINFFIFIRIIQILVSKLRAHQMRYTDYKFRWVAGTALAPHAHGCIHWCVCAHPTTPVLTGPSPRRLAKSTLTLIPLLGIHEVVFAFVTDEHAQGTLRYVKLFFDLFLSSFQVSPGPHRTGPPQGPSVSAGTRSGLGLESSCTPLMPLLPLPRGCWWPSSTASSTRR